MKVRVTVKSCVLWDAGKHIFHCAKLIACFRSNIFDEITSRTPEMAARDILSELILHNLHFTRRKQHVKEDEDGNR